MKPVDSYKEEWFQGFFKENEDLKALLTILENRMKTIHKLSTNLQHGERCFKSHSYKDEGRCRCSLEELLKLLAE